jgi:hypothetical protein
VIIPREEYKEINVDNSSDDDRSPPSGKNKQLLSNSIILRYTVKVVEGNFFLG